MIIYVAGSGYVSKKAAEDLLMDFVVEANDAQEVTFVLPSYLTSDGLRNVKDAIDSINRLVWPEDFEGTYWNLVRHKKSAMLGVSLEAKDAGYQAEVFMVLDAESEIAMVTEMVKRKVPVYDLSKGLWPVSADGKGNVSSEVPLSVAESHADGLSLSPWYQESLGESEPSQAISEPSEGMSISSVFTPEQVKEIERIVQGIISISRPDLHPVYSSPAVETAGEELTIVAEPSTCNLEEETVVKELSDQVGKTKYYKQSKTGKLRKAGKSKARPGEEEIWLTPEQESSL